MTNKQLPKKFITDEDIRILELMALGLKTKEIADRMGYSKLTLDSYRRDICKFLGAKNGVHAVVIALQKGYFKLGELNKSPSEKSIT